ASDSGADTRSAEEDGGRGSRGHGTYSGDEHTAGSYDGGGRDVTDTDDGESSVGRRHSHHRGAGGSGEGRRSHGTGSGGGGGSRIGLTAADRNLTFEELATLCADMRERWLKSQEIYQLLHSFRRHGIYPLSEAVQRPASGTWFIYAP